MVLCPTVCNPGLGQGLQSTTAEEGVRSSLVGQLKYSGAVTGLPRSCCVATSAGAKILVMSDGEPSWAELCSANCAEFYSNLQLLQDSTMAALPAHLSGFLIDRALFRLGRDANWDELVSWSVERPAENCHHQNR